MKCKVLTNLSHDGKDYVPGDVVELTEAQVKPLLPDVVEPMGKMKSEPAPAIPSDEEEDEEELSYNELREKAKELGVPANGSKEDLKERIAEAEAKADEEADEEETGDEEEDEDPGANL
jgi:hypothetical protein